MAVTTVYIGLLHIMFTYFSLPELMFSLTQQMEWSDVTHSKADLVSELKLRDETER